MAEDPSERQLDALLRSMVGAKPTGADAKDHLSYEQLAALVDETMDDVEREIAGVHLDVCPACAAELVGLRELRISSPPATRATPRSTERPLWRAWPQLAAAAVVLLAAGTLVWRLWWAAPSLPATSTQASNQAPKATSVTGPAPITPTPQTAPSPTPAVGQPVPTSSARGRSIAPVPEPAITLDELTHVEPPPYISGTLRGQRDEGAVHFDTAMQRYVDKDYVGAIPDLRAAIGLDSRKPNATFFLAICQLLTDQLDPAIEGLQQTIALGDSPYLAEAHFYLAKARLRQGRLSDARAELTEAIASGGLVERDARKLRTQVDVLIQGRGK